MKTAIIGSNEFVLGICEIQNLSAPNPQTNPATWVTSAFGNVRDATLTRNGESMPIESCEGGLLAFLIHNPSWELKMDILVKPTLVLPDFGSRIAFPLTDIYGFLIPPMPVTWGSKALKKISVTATHWDSLGSNPAVTITDY